MTSAGPGVEVQSELLFERMVLGLLRGELSAVDVRRYAELSGDPVLVVLDDIAEAAEAVRAESEWVKAELAKVRS